MLTNINIAQAQEWEHVASQAFILMLQFQMPGHSLVNITSAPKKEKYKHSIVGTKYMSME